MNNTIKKPEHLMTLIISEEFIHYLSLAINQLDGSSGERLLTMPGPPQQN